MDTAAKYWARTCAEDALRDGQLREPRGYPAVWSPSGISRSTRGLLPNADIFVVYSWDMPESDKVLRYTSPVEDDVDDRLFAFIDDAFE